MDVAMKGSGEQISSVPFMDASAGGMPRRLWWRMPNRAALQCGSQLPGDRNTTPTNQHLRKRLPFLVEAGYFCSFYAKWN
jgi:hypothetical protein